MVNRMIQRREENLRAHDVSHGNSHGEPLPRRSTLLYGTIHDSVKVEILERVDAQDADDALMQVLSLREWIRAVA